MLCHASSNAVMLTFTHGAQVTQTKLGSGILPVERRIIGYRQTYELLHLSQHLFAFGRQFTRLLCFLQGLCDAGIAVGTDEPSRTVASVVRHIERHIALWRRRQLLRGRIIVIVQIVATGQILVGRDFLTCRLCHQARRQCEGKQDVG